MSKPKLSEKMTATRAFGQKVVPPMTWIRNGSGLWLPEAHEQGTHRPQRQPPGWYKLGRDVLVNVVANLVAAAVIYLFAKGSGYIKGNPAVTSAAVAVVTGTLVFSLALLLARLDPGGDSPIPMLLLFGVAVAGRALNATLNPTIGGRRIFAAAMGLTLAGICFGWGAREERLFPVSKHWKSLLAVVGFSLVAGAIATAVGYFGTDIWNWIFGDGTNWPDDW